MQYTTDLAVIGGGAAGLVSAISVKRLRPDLSVALIEGLDRVGKKLITTGNGRCNITNLDLSLSHFHGEEVEFAKYALSEYGGAEIKDFFESIGVDFVNEGDRVYPASLQAASVVDALRFECDRLGIETHLSCGVTEIRKKGDKFFLSSPDKAFISSAVIVASGLFSGGEKIGSNGSVFRILKDMGFGAVKATPSLVQLKTETELVRQLKGIKVVAKATLLREGVAVCENFDEVLFCDYGLSGPAILQISRGSARDDKNYAVSLDLFPDTEESALIESLKLRCERLSDRTLEDFFTGKLNKRLGQVVLKSLGFKLGDSVSSFDASDLEKLAKRLKALSFKVTSNTGFLNSQVTAGGLKTGEFDPKTMMSKKFYGLFCAGEILDVDGDCGGFNLAWAWCSGMTAARGVCDLL